MSRTEFLDDLAAARLVAIIRGTDARASVRTALTLLECGVSHLEISLTTADACDVIRQVAREAQPRSYIGAGTVITASDAARVADAGASFVVTPALSEGVVESKKLDLPVLCGALTPTEVVRAIDLGVDAIKLFPASAGGVRYLSALRDPFPKVSFVPVGGVSIAGAAEYLAAGAIAVGVGSPLIGDAASGGDQNALRARARGFVGLRVI